VGGVSGPGQSAARQALVRVREVELTEEGWAQVESWLTGVQAAVRAALERGDDEGIARSLDNLARALGDVERQDKSPARPGSHTGAPRKVEQYKDGYLNEPIERLLREIDERTTTQNKRPP
jgi:hypothetical protein